VVQPKGRTPGVFAKQAVKTIACGTPDVSGAFVATTLVCFHFLHTGLRTHRASGVPRALSTEGDDVNHTSDVETRRENAKPCLEKRCLEDDVSKSRISKLAFRR
jgi:hypothetical protein